MSWMMEVRDEVVGAPLPTVLARLADRWSITLDDWNDAGTIMNTSRRMRTVIAETARTINAQRERTQTDRSVRTALAIGDAKAATVDKAFEAAVRAVAKRAWRDDDETDPSSVRDLTQAIKGSDRARLKEAGHSIDDVIAAAVNRGHMGVTEQGAYLRGRHRLDSR